MRKSFIAAPLLGSALLLSACAPTIGNKTDLSKVTFEVGKTTKSTVANTLGLPADITHSEALGREYWAYRDKPELTGIIYGLPSGARTETTYEISTGETGEYEFEDAAVVYVFDKDGVLIDVRKPEHNK